MTNLNDDNYAMVPPTFWRNFLPDSECVSDLTDPETGGVWKRYANGWRTIVNWDLGNFAVIDPEGSATIMEGVEFAADDIKALVGNTP